ncbi:MAG: acyl--CoA ligase [Planctomycetes bacterium]|nr:acyl--CoA ligase [Planctomycetota bacterium]
MTTVPRDTTTLWEVFERTVRADPDALALSAPDETITRGQLAEQATELANAMRAAGVREHGLGLIMLPNSVAFVAAFLALTRLPATAALVSTRFRESELRVIAATVRPDFVLVLPQHAAEAAAQLDVETEHDLTNRGGGQRLRLLRLRATAGSVLDVEERFGLGDAGSYPALVKFSSGSTGAPKAVLWTAANVSAAAANVVTTLGLDASDHVLAPVPLAHSYGFDLGVLPLLFAGTSLAIRERPAWKAILAELASGRVSVFLGVPAMYHVLNRTRLDHAPDLSATRYLLSCTAPLPVDLAQAFSRRFRAAICQHYGSSETGGITLCHPGEAGRHPETVGRVMHGVQLSIVGPHGEALPAGSRGEVVIGGAATAAGYVRAATAGDAGGFRDGRYWTGDVGSLSPDGFLHLDRTRPGVAHVGGWKVSLAEVARVLESHPSVRESVVTDVEDARGMAHIVAAVTLQGPVEEQALMAFCRARLADYKQPRRVHILEELPRAASGEVIWGAGHPPA